MLRVLRGASGCDAVALSAQQAIGESEAAEGADGVLSATSVG